MKETRHEITIKIEGEEWTNALDKAFEKRNKNAKIAGFRPGKAPKDVYIKHYGTESLYLDATNSVLNKAYAEMLKKENLIPVTEPKVDIKSVDDNKVEFIFTVITKPEVKIKKYKGLNVKKDEVKVTKKEIDEEIKHLLSHYTELVLKDGEVAKGDVVVIDYEGFKDGVAFEGGKAENYSLEIGSNTFIPGFEDALIGMKQEEERDINLTFPKDYHAKDLAGAKVVFKVKLHEIKEKKERELDEEFFEDLGMEGVNSKESLEAEIKKTFEAKKDADAENKYVDDMLAKVAENTEVEIPEEMIDDEVHNLIHRMDEQLKMQGLSLELYQEYAKISHEDLHKQFEGEARKNVLYRLILEELVKLEKIEVTKEEAEKEADTLAEKYQMTKDALLKEFGGLDIIMYDLEVRKVFDKLKEYNK